MAVKRGIYCERSTYYSFCGNAAAETERKNLGAAGELRSAVCGKWLRPIDLHEHPAFSSWVIYGTSLAGPAAC